MKGLVLSQLKRVDEAHALVKRGLSFNLNSHVCWHVSGLLYRAEQAYDQAIKCRHTLTVHLCRSSHRSTAHSSPPPFSLLLLSLRSLCACACCVSLVVQATRTR